MDQAIKAAQSALGCGEYRQVLQLLEPVAAELPVTMKLGAEVRLLHRRFILNGWLLRI